jgi:hypothetical protein
MRTPILCIMLSGVTAIKLCTSLALDSGTCLSRRPELGTAVLTVKGAQNLLAALTGRWRSSNNFWPDPLTASRYGRTAGSVAVAGSARQPARMGGTKVDAGLY